MSSLSQNPKKTLSFFSTMKNPNNPLKKRLTSRFLKAMEKIKYNMSPSPVSLEEKRRRHRAVRGAAYASMASAVGPRRAWSRALLRKMKGRKRAGRNPRNVDTRFGLNQLCDVVPGGEAMDSRSLLNETAHYIKCLVAQVQIMREILQSSSSSSTTL
ncbi:transcription factor IBH1-like [Salvia hispanica]|uniref:transcription factor IBH1-like n=1 Tax=Salvia hispanica TaxID=49212 RepID=UPI00200915A1|nr:transcription factor IBH1-like [Salvia hispanica]